GRGDLGRAIVRGDLNQGFRLPEAHLILITFDEIFGTRKRQPAASTKGHPSHFLTSLSELQQDDHVVHLDHGIGVYRGLKFLKVAGVEGEFLHLEYEAGDRLYLPVDRINMVQKYIGGDGAQPSLDRLGGTAWEKVKAKARKSIFAMAEELVQLYAIREARAGNAFAPADNWYREFEAAFEYEETPDQQRAIDETLAGMQSRKPMDRLICGDVGYGKTEVAMRAAFLAVEGGKQVAVLAPTTILAQQHLQTFRHRFRNYPVRVEMISRFLTTKEIAQILQETAKGIVDIIIGTHRLLQKDVEFKDHGLVTIDRLALKLADSVPEAKLAVAHGQMRPRELEKVMLDFLENKTQVLVCSAIIESGLDFPNANTIIINRADKFGLAQLYQLRGRV